MRRWILRVVAGLVLLSVAGAGVMFIAFSRWKSAHVRELEAGSQIMTTALGDIELAVAGKGMPYLSIHGTPGGYDQVLAGRRANPDADSTNVMSIAVSRPGCLRTPLSSGKSFEQQADLLAALLDELKVDRALIAASSGGGYVGLSSPCAIQTGASRLC